MNLFFPKRWLRLLFISILFFGLIVFVYVRRGIFFQQAKKLIEQNLEKSFPCKLTIEKIEPNLFYGLRLKNLEVTSVDTSSPFFNIKVDQAFIDANLWRIILASYRKNYSFSEDQLALFFTGGQISLGPAKPLFNDLQGRLILSENALHFQDIQAGLKQNSRDKLKIYGELTEQELSLTANLQHLKIGNFDILTNLTLVLKKQLELQDKAQKIFGTLATYGSVVNNQPFPELKSSFEIKDNKLRLLSLSLGEEYDLRGIVHLSPPFHADLSLNFYHAALDRLTAQLGLLEDANFSGSLNGLIKITGEFPQPKVEGYLEAKQGHLGDLDFVSADINIGGRYPKILIIDSRICREEDYFILEGEINLAALEAEDFLDVNVEPDKSIFWQGWDITRRHENQVHMSKNIGDDLKVTFDTFMDDEREIYNDNDKDELALEYRIFGDKLLKLRLRKEEGILGVERRVNF